MTSTDFILRPQFPADPPDLLRPRATTGRNSPVDTIPPVSDEGSGDVRVTTQLAHRPPQKSVRFQIKTAKLVGALMWTTAATGGLIYLAAAYRLDLRIVNSQFLVLAAITTLLSSRISIQIPQFRSQISVSDTFIFLALVLYGCEAAILLAATEAFVSSFRISRKAITILFNWGCGAWSVFITSYSLKLLYGDPVELSAGPLSGRFIAAIGFMALVQYATNSGLVAICAALKAGTPIWQTWKKHYLWTSITYFVGATAAVMIARLMGSFGFYALVVSLPIIAIVFFTYQTYLKNVEASTQQAEQAERHVLELSHFIAEQERIREQFSQMEKLSALGELASGVAHDFNNTLAGILGRAQLILRTDDPEKIKRGLNIIIKTAEDGARTVKRIQDFARQRRDHDFKPVAIGQILLDVSEVTKPLWKDRAEAANVQISLDLQIDSNTRVMGDESELREVLVNMVFNAVDAMPAGGKLSLTATDIDESVVISVRDTGTGMPAEVKSRIFDPFFTTKGKAGMGLGLAVSFGIIRRHEGSIEVDSELGTGTTFRIVLPQAQGSRDEVAPEFESEPAVSATASSPVAESGAAYQPSILVVDDEEGVRELLRDLVESEGCRVTVAANGREALTIFGTQQFDAIFTDVGMPGMSGWELANAIRERNEKIPIAVITGWGEAVGSDEQRKARVDWVVTKPFRAERISELVREISAASSFARRSTLSIVAA